MAGSASPHTMLEIKMSWLNRCTSLEEQQEKAKEILNWMDGWSPGHFADGTGREPHREQLTQLLNA